MLPEGWERSTVGRTCAIKNNLRLPLNAEERTGMAGPYPYFGPTGVLGHIDHYRIDEEFALIGEDGDHFLKFRDRPMTLMFSGKANVNNHAHIIGNSEFCSAQWFHYWFMHRDLTAVLSRQGVGRYKLTKAGLEKLEIWLPPTEEQARISRVLGAWGAAIATTERLLANSRMLSNALSQQLLTGRRRTLSSSTSGSTVSTRYGPIPKDWNFVKIGEIAIEVSERHTGDERYPVLSCSKYHGFVSSLVYFKKQVFSNDLSNYKMVRRGDFGFPSNHIEEGSIGHQNVCDYGVVSPIYTVFRAGPNVLGSFLYKLLKTDHYRQIFSASTNASVDRRGSLRWDEFSKIRVPLPSLEEQSKISSIMDVATEESENLQKQLLALHQQKRVLMQQLLTGKRRVKFKVASQDAP